MFGFLRRLPFLKLLAVFQLALLARRQFQQLDATDRRRLGELLRRGPRMERAERKELGALLTKLEPRTFAAAAANAFSPVRLPRRFTGG